MPPVEHKAAEVKIYDCLQKIELEPRFLAGSFVLSFIALPTAHSFETFKSNLVCFHFVPHFRSPALISCGRTRGNFDLTHSRVNEKATHVLATRV